MTNVCRNLFLLSVVLCLGPTAAWASSVIVNTGLSLTELQISPATGTLDVLSPVTVSTYAEALDSSGGFDDSASNPANAADSTLATASGAGSGSALTGSVTANINLPDSFNGFGSSTGQSSLSGSFQIISTSSSPIDVTLSAALSGSQFLQTTGNGVLATSEIIFTLLLPDLSASPILALDNPLSIGPGSETNAPYSSTLTTSVSLSPNTDYSFVVSLDAESEGVSITPEPSSLSLVLTSVGLLAVLGRRLTSKRNPDRRG